MAERGGKREGAGRKPIADEEKANQRLLAALKVVYKKDTDEENIIRFLQEYVKTKDGMNFFAQHIIGKPKEKIEHSGDLQTPIIKFTKSD